MSYLNIIKSYTCECVNVLIITESTPKSRPETIPEIINCILESFNLNDIKTSEKIYSHLDNLMVKKHIDVLTYNSNNVISNKDERVSFIDSSTKLREYYDIIIIDYEGTIISEFINKTNIFILNYTTKIIYRNWSNITKNNTTILLNEPSEWFINYSNKIHYYHELMYFIDKIITKNNIQYVMIKSSCLGCIRNRNHIVFCEKIHIAVNKTMQKNISNIENEFKKYKIYLNKVSEYRWELQLENYVTCVIHFYDIINDICYINNIEIMNVFEIGNTKRYTFGPLRVSSLEYPISYLKRSYGENVFNQLEHNNIIIKNYKFLYDSYYNQWSSYTSNYWKTLQIQNLYNVYSTIKKQNICCWIDCGTLLGAARSGSIPFFDDDTDIGCFEKDINKINQCLKNVKMSSRIKYVNDGRHFKDFFNLKISYNKKENINYIFSENINLCCEFRVYTSYDNYYISLKDDIVSNAHKVSGLKLKRAIPKQIFHRFTSIILGNYMFDCPLDYKIYLESQARYGKDSIDGNPIRDCKPGVIVLYDDFI